MISVFVHGLALSILDGFGVGFSVVMLWLLRGDLLRAEWVDRLVVRTLAAEREHRWA